MGLDQAERVEVVEEGVVGCCSEVCLVGAMLANAYDRLPGDSSECSPATL